MAGKLVMGRRITCAGTESLRKMRKGWRGERGGVIGGGGGCGSLRRFGSGEGENSNLPKKPYVEEACGK